MKRLCTVSIYCNHLYTGASGMASGGCAAIIPKYVPAMNASTAFNVLGKRYFCANITFTQHIIFMQHMNIIFMQHIYPCSMCKKFPLHSNVLGFGFAFRFLLKCLYISLLKKKLNARILYSRHNISLNITIRLYCCVRVCSHSLRSAVQEGRC